MIVASAEMTRNPRNTHTPTAMETAAIDRRRHDRTADERSARRRFTSTSSSSVASNCTLRISAVMFCLCPRCVHRRVESAGCDGRWTRPTTPRADGSMAIPRPVGAVAPTIARPVGSATAGSRPRSGERGERSLDAAEHSRRIEVGATASRRA